MSISKNSIELLSPAKNLECGKAAINCGADALYIGANNFGARRAAGNEMEDIDALCEYAHQFNVKVYLALNTILNDTELDEANSIAWDAYNAGVDALIIQDMGLLETKLPPLPLIASTQTNNTEASKIKFFEETGFSRVILARELNLDEIKNIKKNSSIELESFIHGALCVCYSGQCYLSEATKGRSANRGICAQSCRLPYDLSDANGTIIERSKHFLSINDLNLTANLEDLLDAGITSFKIEGRLKDIDYVKNITAWYRLQLDKIIEKRENIKRASSGKSILNFTPDPARSFNRRFTDYFVTGERKSMATLLSPKATGQYIGTVKQVSHDFFTIDSKEIMANGDGLCFFDTMNELQGFRVNKIEGDKIIPLRMPVLVKGMKLYRNEDHQFSKLLQQDECTRKIYSKLKFSDTISGFKIEATDEDSNTIIYEETCEKQDARNAELASKNINEQLAKSGDSIFIIDAISIKCSQAFFIPKATLNKMRREALQLLKEKRTEAFKRKSALPINDASIYPYKEIDYRGNISNKNAEAFFTKHQSIVIDKAPEITKDFEGIELMKTKYCIRFEIDKCPIHQKASASKHPNPWYLNDGKNKLRIEFNCKECVMVVKSEIGPSD